MQSDVSTPLHSRKLTQDLSPTSRLDPYEDPALPPADALTWQEKDRFVRLNGQARHNPKVEAAAVGGGGVGLVAACAGLLFVTAGIAAPLIIGGIGVACASGAGKYKMRKSKPDGLRKHIFNDLYPTHITKPVSAKIVEDLKFQGVYNKGRTRKLLQIENLDHAINSNVHVPEEKRSSIASIVRFHNADVAWRNALSECKHVYKREFKSYRLRPSKRRQIREPGSLYTYEQLLEVRTMLKSLKVTTPSRRHLARTWIEAQRDAVSEPAKQVVYDNLLTSLERQAHIY